MKNLRHWARLLWALLMTFAAILYWIWPDPRHWWTLPLLVTVLAVQAWEIVSYYRSHDP